MDTNRGLTIFDYIKFGYWLIISLTACITLGFWLNAGAPSYPYSNWGAILGIFLWITTTLIIINLSGKRVKDE